MNLPNASCVVCGAKPELRPQYCLGADRQESLPWHEGWMIQVYPWSEGRAIAQRETSAICPTCAKRIADFQKFCADNPRQARSGYGR